MSPTLSLVLLGVLLGNLVFIGAMFRRKHGCALMMLPFPLLVVAWLVVNGIPPNAEKEFDRLFGQASRPMATEIEAIRPPFMDGYLISFRISGNDYARITSGTFRREPPGEIGFFGKARRPSSWPPVLDMIEVFDRCNYGKDYLLVYYDRETQTAYAAFHKRG